MPTSVLGRVCAPRWVILPKPLHHVLDPPDLLLDLPVEHLILKQPRSRSKKVAAKECPSPFPASLKPEVDGALCMQTHINTHTHLQQTITHTHPPAHTLSSTHIPLQHTHTPAAHFSFSWAASASPASIKQS